VYAHVQVGYPHNGKKGNQITPPIVVQQLVMGKNKEEGGNVMAEAIFTRKEIEELALQYGLAVSAFTYTKVFPFAKHFFMRNRPGYAGHGYG
jgi:hypothetical protein